MPVTVQGPDNRQYQFPDGTTKQQAIAYFKAKGIGVPPPASAGPTDTRNAFQRGIDTITQVTPSEPGVWNHIVNAAENMGAGVLSPLSVLAHPIQTAKMAVNSVVQGESPVPVRIFSDTPTMQESMSEGLSENPAGTVEQLAGTALGGEVTGEVTGPLTERLRGFVANARDAAENVGSAPRTIGKIVEETQKENATGAEAHKTATEEYNRKVGKTVQKNKEISDAERAKTNRAADIQVKGSQIIDRIRRLNDKVHAQANSLYDAVREKVGDASVPRKSLQEEVKDAEAKWIRGSPEKVREFQEILRNPGGPSGGTLIADQAAKSAGYDDFQQALEYGDEQTINSLRQQLPRDVWDEAVARSGKPLSWNDLQGFYEETGSKLASGNLPGDVYQAVKQVHESVGQMMQKLADEKGAGADFTAARKFYREYMETFNEPTGPSGSGSPVAQALRSKDPATAVRFFSGAAGDRGIAMLRRYDPEIASLAQEAQKAARETVRVPTGKRASTADLRKPEFEPKTIGEKDIQDIKQKRLEQAANHIRHWGTYLGFVWPAIEVIRTATRGEMPDVGSTAVSMVATPLAADAIAKIIESPKMKFLLTRATPRDIAQIPPELRGDLPAIVNQAEKSGITVSPAMKAAIGIAGAVGPKTRLLQELRGQPANSAQ